MNIDPNTTKYMIKAKLTADGIVEKPDVVGAIFGQTEGLLGDELDLRDLQKSGRIGRIEVEVSSKGGKSDGTVYMSSSLDQVETAILASALETVDRVGPCKAGLRVLGIEDVRVTKRELVVERAKELLNEMIKQSKGSSGDLTDSIRQSIQVEEITSFGKDRCPAGPNVKDSEAIIIVEGRSDVLNLLKAGIKNAIAVEGTNIPKTVQDLSKERVVTAFTDGDRGGELILRELFQVAEVDFVARAPRAHEVEELTPKQIIKCLRNKVPGDQYMEMNGLTAEAKEGREAPAKEEDEEDETRIRARTDRREKYREERPRRGREEREEREPRFNSESAEKFKKREHREDSEEEERPRRGREEREEHESRFNTDAAEKFKKRRTEEPEEKPVAEPEEKADEPVKEAPVKEAPAKAEKPTRTLRAKKEPAAKRKDKVLSPEQEKFRTMLLDMASTHNAKMLNSDNEVINEVAVKSLVNTLKEESEGVTSIVFDGVISQRIVDVSAEKNIGVVVGTRKGNITKMPAGIVLWTKEDLY
jgi:DNA primase